MVQTRIAPTPSGYLHVGNALNFLLTEALARRAGGRLHLRIDDLDRERVRPAYLDNIFQTLRWLGIEWDSGPRDVADFLTHYSQHLRLDRYAALLDRLAAVPGLVYTCGCSRSQLAASADLGHHSDVCPTRQLPLTTPDVAWRVRVPAEATIALTDGILGEQRLRVAELVGDFVIRKKDGLPAYQTASLADDVAYGTTLIVRGQDLLPSTAAQLWLAEQAGDSWTSAFGAVQFYHHPLIAGPDGEKLSKSQQTPLDRGALADPSLSPAALRARAQEWLAG